MRASQLPAIVDSHQPQASAGPQARLSLATYTASQTPYGTRMRTKVETSPISATNFRRIACNNPPWPLPE